MKHSWILCTAAITLAAGPAFAADIPVKAKAPAAVAAAYNWTGLYIGGNVGYGWGSDTGALWDSFVDAPFVGIAPYFAVGGNVLPGVKPSGVIGGAQIGYNWQAAPNWVLGLVADIQASDMRALASNTVTPGGARHRSNPTTPELTGLAPHVGGLAMPPGTGCSTERAAWPTEA